MTDAKKETRAERRQFTKDAYDIISAQSKVIMRHTEQIKQIQSAIEGLITERNREQGIETPTDPIH